MSRSTDTAADRADRRRSSTRPAADTAPIVPCCPSAACTSVAKEVVNGHGANQHVSLTFAPVF